jgi:membrane protein implicated in regulation of membrane protease activity
MALLLVILLIVLALTGSLVFVLKVALGVALGVLIGVALVVALVGWRIRRALFGPRRRRWSRRSSSRIQVLDRRDDPARGY